MAVGVAVIGTGYVGLVTALAFAHQGSRVTCVDVDHAKVKSVNRGKAPFFEPGVDESLRVAVKEGRIVATEDGGAAVRAADFSFLCVGTPPRRNGSLDDAQVRQAARSIGLGLRDRQGDHVVVVKSTVLPGTTESVVLSEIQRAAGKGGRFGLCVNPEFLREGSALDDALHPDRIIIGEDSRESGDALEALYGKYECPKFRSDLRTAEMVKYATNAFLATKVSFANELANLCDGFQVDWDRVVAGMGLDSRINPRFMVPGLGFGGSCFTKDVTALLMAGKRTGYTPAVLPAVLKLNDRQPLRAVEILKEEIGGLAGKKLAVLGLAFKPGTDDVRESRAIPLCKELIRQKARVVGYDPVAGPNFAKVLPQVKVVKTRDEALAGASGTVIQADWAEFRAMKAADFSGMKKAVVVDGRRTFGRSGLGGRVVYRRIG